MCVVWIRFVGAGGCSRRVWTRCIRRRVVVVIVAVVAFLVVDLAVLEVALRLAVGLRFPLRYRELRPEAQHGVEMHVAHALSHSKVPLSVERWREDRLECRALRMTFESRRLGDGRVYEDLQVPLPETMRSRNNA